MNARRVVSMVALMVVLGGVGCGPEGAALQEQQVAAAPTPAPVQQESPTPTVIPADYSSTLAGSIQRINSLEELAWTSHQIVVGTVVEEQPAVWGDAYNPRDPSRRLIYTRYVVQVESRVRGQPTDTVVVRQMGGTIGSCTQTNMLEHSLTVGDRVLLFLRPSNPQGSVPTYSLNGGNQGLWAINASGAVTTDVGHLQRYNGQLLAALIAQMGSILAVPPTDNPVIREYFVPLDIAPVPVANAGA